MRHGNGDYEMAPAYGVVESPLCNRQNLSINDIAVHTAVVAFQCARKKLRIPFAIIPHVPDCLDRRTSDTIFGQRATRLMRESWRWP
jgi:hypothetical protein